MAIKLADALRSFDVLNRQFKREGNSREYPGI